MKRNLQFFVLALLMSSTAAVCQNGSASFDGNDFIEVPEITAVTGANARTVEAWIKVPLESNSEQVLVQWGVDDAGTKWTIRLNAGSVLRVEHGSGATFGSTALNDDAWHHVAVALAESAPLSEAKLYVDGVEETYGQQAGAACNTGSHVIWIGKANTKVSDGDKPIPVRHWIGLMDELRIWNVARTVEEIAALKDSSICPSQHEGLLAAYRFNETDGVTAADLSGNFDGLLGGNADSTNLMPTWTDTGAPVDETDCGSDVGVNQYRQKVLSIYPNPVSDRFEISSNLLFDQLAIYDLTGKQMMQVNNPVQTSIDVSHLSGGIYFVKFSSGSSIVATSKLIKK